MRFVRRAVEPKSELEAYASIGETEAFAKVIGMDLRRSRLAVALSVVSLFGWLPSMRAGLAVEFPAASLAAGATLDVVVRHGEAFGVESDLSNSSQQFPVASSGRSKVRLGQLPATGGVYRFVFKSGSMSKAFTLFQPASSGGLVTAAPTVTGSGPMAAWSKFQKAVTSEPRLLSAALSRVDGRMFVTENIGSVGSTAIVCAFVFVPPAAGIAVGPCILALGKQGAAYMGEGLKQVAADLRTAGRLTSSEVVAVGKIIEAAVAVASIGADAATGSPAWQLAVSSALAGLRLTSIPPDSSAKATLTWANHVWGGAEKFFVLAKTKL